MDWKAAIYHVVQQGQGILKVLELIIVVIVKAYPRDALDFRVQLFSYLRSQIWADEVDVALQFLDDLPDFGQFVFSQVVLLIFRFLRCPVQFGEAIALQALQFFDEYVLCFVQSVDLRLLLTQHCVNIKLFKLVIQLH